MIDLVSAAIGRAFNRTKEILLPFRLTIWIKLAFVYFFLSGGASSNFSNFSRLFPKNYSPTTTSEKTAWDPETDKFIQEIKSKLMKWNMPTSIDQAKAFFKENKRTILAVSAILALILLLMIVILIWLSARMNFVALRWLETKEFFLRSAWRETRTLGESFFWFNLVVSLVMLTMLIVPASVGGYLIYKRQFAIGTALAVFTVVETFVLMLVGIVFYRFVPVVMFYRNASAAVSAREALKWIRENFGQACVNLIFYALLAIGLNIAFFLVMGFVFLLFVAIVAFSVPFLLLGKPMWTFITLAVGMGFLSLIFLALLMVPVNVILTYLRMELVEPKLASMEL